MMGDFQNGLISRIFCVFGAVFFLILIFDRKYSLCMMGDFQDGVISRIFSAFWSENNFK